MASYTVARNTGGVPVGIIDTRTLEADAAEEELAQQPQAPPAPPLPVPPIPGVTAPEPPRRRTGDMPTPIGQQGRQQPTQPSNAQGGRDWGQILGVVAFVAFFGFGIWTMARQVGPPVTEVSTATAAPTSAASSVQATDAPGPDALLQAAGFIPLAEPLWITFDTEGDQVELSAGTYVVIRPEQRAGARCPLLYVADAPAFAAASTDRAREAAIAPAWTDCRAAGVPDPTPTPVPPTATPRAAPVYQVPAYVPPPLPPAAPPLTCAEIVVEGTSYGQHCAPTRAELLATNQAIVESVP